jgi:hypothetical protein
MDPFLDLLNQRPRENWEWRFEPAAAGRSDVNAVALCNAALLAYSDQAGARHFLSKWSFSDVRFLRGFQTQGFVARREGIVVVAFRGTEPANAADWLSDVNFHPRPLSPQVRGSVHGGFARALEEVKGPMLQAVAALLGEGQPRLYITGHSLGGALAVLAGAVLEAEAGRQAAAIYTYGQPRVGDRTFCQAFGQRLGGLTFRYVNDFDIVPHLPPVRLLPPPPGDLIDPFHWRSALARFLQSDQFSHAGRLLLLLPDGTVTSDENRWRERELALAPSLEDVLFAFPSLLQAEWREALSAGNRILDHDPLRGYLPKLEALAR